MDIPVGAGRQGMIWSQITSENSFVACKFKKTHEKENLEIRKLNKNDRLTSLRRTVQHANDAVKLPDNPHILNFKGMIFSEELNQYGMIYEKIDGCSLEEFLKSNNNYKCEKKIAKVFKEITLGLQVLSEAGMPHTDLLQPGYNIMVRYSDDTAVVVDIDGAFVEDEYRESADAESKKQLAIITCSFLAKQRFNGSHNEDANKFLLCSDYSEDFKLVMTKCLSSENLSWTEVMNAIEVMPC
ncbi:MAG: protein kinase family protein [Parachlamydiaceae bacterium]|nr:protein kinase family protein [Parachlamydiaceae bacterium]